MDELSDINDLSTICRVCLEKAPKMYPLVGPIVNVYVDVAVMISYCTAEEIELSEDLPKAVCLPCFRTVRIAYNFLLEFREAEKKLQEFRRLSREKEVNQLQQTLNTDFLPDEPAVIQSEYLNQGDGNEDDVIYRVIKTEGDTNIEYIENIFDTVSDTHIKEEENITNIEVNKSQDEIKLKPQKNTPCLSLRRKATVKYYQCPICSKTMSKFNAVFLPHLILHKGESFNCILCDNTAELDLEDYIAHFKQFHLHQCTICNKSFDNKSSYNYHAKVHTEPKVYACSYENCTKKFINSWGLKKHLYTHTKSAKYICSKCGRKFHTYDTFRYHLRTHDGKRNYLCTECGQSFLQSVHLKYHMWKHTGVKQFHCKKCDKSYTSVTQLKKHLRKYCGFDEAESTNS